VKHLKLKDQLVMGGNKEQTHRILNKMEADPIMSLIVHNFDVNLIPISQEDVLQQNR
jgi:hypothetical protein